MVENCTESCEHRRLKVNVGKSKVWRRRVESVCNVGKKKVMIVK